MRETRFVMWSQNNADMSRISHAQLIPVPAGPGWELGGAEILHTSECCCGHQDCGFGELDPIVIGTGCWSSGKFF